MRILLVSFAVVIVACGNEPPRACAPGMSIACVGVGGCSGGQVCNAEGTAFGTCDCGELDAGPPSRDAELDAPAIDAAADDAAADDAAIDDAAIDGPAEDAPSAPCDPVAQTGCGPGERCTHVRLTAELGELRCEPDGAIALHGACTAPELGSADDCMAGLACVGGSCEEICSLAPDSCGAGFACRRYAGISDATTAGICDPTCDPVRQTRDHDGAAACGSPDPTSPTRGCYGTPTGVFTCSPVATGARDRRHRDPALGPSGGGVFLNGCAPGFVPLLQASSTDPTVVCAALCDPEPTSAASPSLRGGLSPYSCADRGATASTEECRYLDLLAGEMPTGRDIGFCFDHTRYTYDDDMDVTTPPVPMPSCTTLTGADTDGDGVADTVANGCALP